MQQQIDLLTDDLKRRKELLTFSNMLFIWAAFSVVLVLFTGWDGIGLYQLSTTHEESEQKTKILARANQVLKEQVDVGMDAELQREVEALRKRQAEQRQLLSVLVGYQSERNEGFSAYLKELAEHSVDDMWLKEITFEHGGERIRLKGMTTDAVKLPEFLQRLSAGERFHGHLFDDFEIREAESGVLEFDITGPHEVAPG